MIWRFGTICEVDSDNRSLVKVKIYDRVTKLLPVMMFANDMKKVWSPPKVGQQVVVLGEKHSDGVVISGAIYYQECQEPAGANPNTDIIEYTDGTRIEYDTTSSKLKIKAVGDVEMNCRNAKIRADTVLVDSPKVDLGGSGGKGVVTGDCICPYTGNPHADLSSIVKATK